MAQSKKQVADYEALRAELDQILADLQSDGNVDESIKRYKRGLELVEALEKYLETAENDIKELKAKFSAET
jgi:exodeoxyribonuclease VII small subunit